MTETVELPKTRHTDVGETVETVDLDKTPNTATKRKRINVPLNLDNWKDQPKERVEVLTWFHQYVLDNELSYDDILPGFGYKNGSTIYRVLTGDYEGNWDNVIEKILSWKSLQLTRASLAKIQFARNKVTDRIFWILDYTLHSASMSLIFGESGVGKNAGGEEWKRQNNHGRSVWVECVPYGGPYGLWQRIAKAVGVNPDKKPTPLMNACAKAFNGDRILILNEVQHLIPYRADSRPTSIEMIRRLHDLRKNAVAMFATYRAEEGLTSGGYMYEQFLGRTGQPFYLPNKFDVDDLRPIVSQVIPNPSRSFLDTTVEWANTRSLGRMRYVTNMLCFAQKVAHDKKKQLTEKFVIATHKLRTANAGENPNKQNNQ